MLTFLFFADYPDSQTWQQITEAQNFSLPNFTRCSPAYLKTEKQYAEILQAKSRHLFQDNGLPRLSKAGRVVLAKYVMLRLCAKKSALMEKRTRRLQKMMARILMRKKLCSGYVNALRFLEEQVFYISQVALNTATTRTPSTSQTSLPKGPNMEEQAKQREQVFKDADARREQTSQEAEMNWKQMMQEFAQEAADIITKRQKAEHERFSQDEEETRTGVTDEENQEREKMQQLAKSEAHLLEQDHARRQVETQEETIRETVEKEQMAELKETWQAFREELKSPEKKAEEAEARANIEREEADPRQAIVNKEKTTYDAILAEKLMKRAEALTLQHAREQQDMQADEIKGRQTVEGEEVPTFDQILLALQKRKKEEEDRRSAKQASKETDAEKKERYKREASQRKAEQEDARQRQERADKEKEARKREEEAQEAVRRNAEWEQKEQDIRREVAQIYITYLMRAEFLNNQDFLDTYGDPLIQNRLPLDNSFDRRKVALYEFMIQRPDRRQIVKALLSDFSDLLDGAIRLRATDLLRLGLDPLQPYSSKALNKQYRRLAPVVHPDKNTSNPEEAKKQFQQLKEAYERLLIQ